jgi:hypothetical protein
MAERHRLRTPRRSSDRHVGVWLLSALVATATLLVMAEPPVASAGLVPVAHTPTCTSILSFGLV